MPEELKQAAQQALEALEHAEKDTADFQRLNTDQTSAAIKSLRRALTQRPAAQAGEVDTGPRVLREVFALCEDTMTKMESESTEFSRGRAFEAKGISRAIGTWFQDEFCGRSHMGEPVTLPAAQAAPAQEVVDERLWDLFIRWETVAFGDFKAEVRAAFDLEPTERDDKRAAFTEWLQTTWPMIYPKGCADDLWRNGHLATLALAWQAHIARKANIAPQFQIARQSPQQAAPEPVGEVVAWLYAEDGETKFGHPRGYRPDDARPLVFGDTRPAPGVPPTKDQIREVFIGNGFTVKEGQADLKPYVYAAADALLKLVSPSPGVPEGFALVPITDLQALAKRAHELRDRQYDVSGSALFGDDKVKNFREQQPLVYAVACEVGVGLFCLADDLDALAAAQAKGGEHE